MVLKLRVVNYKSKMRFKFLTPREWSLLQLGLRSRILLFLFQVCINFLPDHDADAFKPPEDDSEDAFQGSTDTFVHHRLLAGFSKWDSLHFLHVARKGYVLESDLAFFPGFPLVIRWIEGAALRPYLGEVLTTATRFLLAATVLNNVLFIVSGVLLYRLGRRLNIDAEVARLGVVWFYFNPASVFFSSAYSESLFFFVILLGLRFLHGNSFLSLSLAASSFCAASYIRSNGLVFIGFFWFFLLNHFLTLVEPNMEDLIVKGSRLFLAFVKVVVASAIAAYGFVAHQLHGADIFCRRLESPPKLSSSFLRFAAIRKEVVKGVYSAEVRANGVVDLKPAALPGWCLHAFPMSYSAIQSKYWDLGFLAYYELKQIPNFLLALPVTLLVLRQCRDLVRCRFRKTNPVLSFFSRHSWAEDEGTLNSWSCLPFHLYTLFLLLFGLCSMHVQVLTRLIFSCCPLTYFYVGSLLKEDDVVAGTYLYTYAGVYFGVGVFMHCNFLPWT